MTRIPAIEYDAASELSLDVRTLRLNDEQFFRLCSDNSELRLELSADGELIIMPPPGSDTGWKEAEIIYQLRHWAKSQGDGITFGSDTGFALPNGARRAPDAAWILRERWNRLTDAQKKRHAPICPDFVVELRSPSNSLTYLQKKMTEYVQNGAKLGWLLDPFNKCVYVYRPDSVPERLDNPDQVSGEDVLPGFQFNFQEILGQP